MEDFANVIELRGVTKDYGDFKLDDISFAVPQGCVCGFIGQNGAGKTTTIQIILDAINRDGGEVYVFGKSIDKDSAALRENIGVVFDEMGFHDFLNAGQINTIMKNVYKNWDVKKFFEYLRCFSLPTKKACGSFSRGMRMKLQIATALSHDAKLLIMDEPTSGLDPVVRNEMLQIFWEFIQGFYRNEGQPDCVDSDRMHPFLSDSKISVPGKCNRGYVRQHGGK